MEISKVRTAKYIGKFILRPKPSPNLIDIEYKQDLPRSILTDDSPRVYLITVNNVIKKIGGSAGKGGIKNTLNLYINARTGSPGAVRFIIHRLIARELKKGRKVDLYMITSRKIKANICGLFDCNEEMEIASFKEMEKLCKFDYLVYNIEEFIKQNEETIKNLDEEGETYQYFLNLQQKIKDLKNLRSGFNSILNEILNLSVNNTDELIRKVKDLLFRNFSMLFKRWSIPKEFYDYDLDIFKYSIIECLKKRYRKIIDEPKTIIKEELEHLQKKEFNIKPFPDWNFQENNESYPQDLYEEYLEYHKNRIKKSNT